MSILQELMDHERELAMGRGPTYERLLHPDALVIVPGAVLDKPACVDAMNASSGRDSVELDDARLVNLDGVAAAVYLFVGRRGPAEYRATLSSTYVRMPDGWRLILHQQTPHVSS